MDLQFTDKFISAGPMQRPMALRARTDAGLRFGTAQDIFESGHPPEGIDRNQMHALLDSIPENAPEIRHAFKFVLVRSRDLTRARLVKEITTLMKDYCLVDDNHWPQRLSDDLGQLMVSETGLKIPNETWQVVLETLREHWTPLSPDRTHFFKFPKLLKALSPYMANQMLPISEIPKHLKRLLEMDELLWGNSSDRLAKTVIPTLYSINDPETTPLERLEMLHQTLMDYRKIITAKDNTPHTPRDDYSSFFTTYENALLRVSPSEWCKVLDTFVDGMELVPQNERYEVKSGHIMLQAARKSLEHGSQGSFLEWALLIQESCEQFNEFQGGAEQAIRLFLKKAHTPQEYRAFMKSFQDLENWITKKTSEEPDPSLTPETSKPLVDFLSRLFPEAEKREIILAGVLRVLAHHRPSKNLLLELTNPVFQQLAGESLQAVCDNLYPKDGSLSDLELYYDSIHKYLARAFISYGDDYYRIALQQVLSMPGYRADVAKSVISLAPVLKEMPSAMAGEEAHASFLQSFQENLRLFTLVYSPNQFLNYFMLNQKKITPRELLLLYKAAEYSDINVTRGILPELMALVQPYLDKLKGMDGPRRNEHINQISQALTRHYDYLGAIEFLQGIAFNNWSRIGTLGLSFTKWQYDAMRRWKNAGPSERKPMLVQSGVFQPIPPRENDPTYFGGFLRYDKASGLSIELRRAYIVISKPGLGTVVIRNSSADFGRNLMAEPAYYHPEKLYSEALNLFNPVEDLAYAGFQSVMSRELNKDADTQQANHQKIKELLDAFEDTVEPYVAWKCGFKDGKPPEGFREMLTAALKSAVHEGIQSPFGRKKNIRLAWVNRYGLPFPVAAFDVRNLQHQAELTAYLNTLEKRQTVLRSEDYERQIPNLLKFLQTGLSQNLELVLTE